MTLYNIIKGRIKGGSQRSKQFASQSSDWLQYLKYNIAASEEERRTH